MFNIACLVHAVCLSIVWTIAILLHRLFFHPLAKFPGPKVAAATFWYEFYYDVTKRGQYFREIGKMHEKYGTS